jgi:diguanylate cyclase
MNEKLVVDDQIKILQKKLHAAIKSRAAIDQTLRTQSTLLTNFIIKLSQVCKGIDVELDHRLADLRSLLTQSAPLSDIEQQITVIAKLIQKHSLKVERDIALIQGRLMNSSNSLQKSADLPRTVKRELSEFVKNAQQTRSTLAQYVPLFSQLVEFYKQTLKASNEPSKGGLLNAKQPEQHKLTNDALVNVSDSLIEKFSEILARLVLSGSNNTQLIALRKKLQVDISNEALLQSCLDLFDVIITDTQQERETAESFLSSLSKTLSTVQSAVKKAITCNRQSYSEHNELNSQLQQQILGMAGDVQKASSLIEVKTDINDKIQKIIGSLEHKYSLEDKQNQIIEDQLSSMKDKVTLLEKQSDHFEKRLKEQQIKSMQDALTKLGNRAAFDDYFAKEFVRYHHQPFDLAIVIMDLDDFKRINDTYGHTAGDKTLQVIANTLKKHVHKDVFVGRYGGEEFVLIYSNIKETKLLAQLNQLREHIARLPFKFKNNKVSITASIGVTHIRPGDNIHIAFERADQSLYQAKDQGKNQVLYS